MNYGQLVGRHEVILNNGDFGIKVIQSVFGLHVVGKNESILASCVGGQFSKMERGIAEHWALRLEQAIINGETRVFTHVYYRQVIKKGA